MSFVSENLWRKLNRTLTARFVAAGVFAGSFGAAASAEVSPSPKFIALGTIGSALMGVFAVGILEWRDHRRDQNAEWQRRIAQKAEQISGRHPGIAPDAARSAAKSAEEQRLTPMVYGIMALGFFSLLCGAVMCVIRAVEFVRTL